MLRAESKGRLGNVYLDNIKQLLYPFTKQKTAKQIPRKGARAVTKYSDNNSGIISGIIRVIINDDMLLLFNPK